MDDYMQSVTPGSLRAIASAIDKDGYACLANYVDPVSLSTMRSFVSSAVSKAQGRYAGFNKPTEMIGSSLDDMARSPCFRDLMRGVYEAGTGRPAPDTDYYQVLRCLSGEDVSTHSLRFHYDSYVLTALIPIEIPASGPKGDLLIIPNVRAVRGNYALNLVDKLLIDNKLSQKWLRYRAASGRKGLVRLSLVPGNLYLFWGYRSIHTNEACDPDKIRATALFHYADPHAGSSLKRRLKRA